MDNDNLCRSVIGPAENRTNSGRPESTRHYGLIKLPPCEKTHDKMRVGESAKVIYEH
jgi:hypothetical protein